MTTPVRTLRPVSESELAQLADVLVDCVEGGASVGFMPPITRERALAFWRGVAAGVSSGDRVLLVADDAHGICGTVQIVFAGPENQPHRADLAKMLVHRRARGRGVGEALLSAADRIALESGRTLLVLDTVTGSAADRLYTRLGWQRVGDVPNYALMTDGKPCSATFFYRDLASARDREPRG